MKHQIAFYSGKHSKKDLMQTYAHPQISFNFTTSKKQLLEIIKTSKVDLIILYDMTHEEQDHLIDQIHRITFLPLMVISSINQINHITHALSVGVDEYLNIADPVSLVIAKIHALIRRSRHIKKLRFGKIKFQHLEFNLNTFEVKGNGATLPITNKEFELIHLFLSNPEHTLKKEDLFQELWKTNEYYSENVINVHMRHIRKKIELNPEQPTVIETVWGFGYRLGKGNLEYLD